MNRERMLTDAVCSERRASRREFRTGSAASLCPHPPPTKGCWLENESVKIKNLCKLARNIKAERPKTNGRKTRASGIAPLNRKFDTRSNGKLLWLNQLLCLLFYLPP